MIRGKRGSDGSLYGRHCYITKSRQDVQRRTDDTGCYILVQGKLKEVLAASQMHHERMQVGALNIGWVKYSV